MITLEAALGENRHPLFINTRLLGGTRHRSAQRGTQRQACGLGLGDSATGPPLLRTPPEVPPLGSEQPSPVFSAAQTLGISARAQHFLVQILGQPPGGPQAPLAAGSHSLLCFLHPSIILHSPYRQWNDIPC